MVSVPLAGALADRWFARRNHLPTPGRYTIATVRIPMRDGVELGADLYTPRGSSRGLVLIRGPYGRDPVMAMPAARLFAGQGYTVLFASSRGTADSGGVFDPMRDEVRDGQDTVTWMRRQPWYPGRFGTVGGSYLGYTQWAMLSRPPVDLAAAVVVMGPHDFARHTWDTGAARLDVIGWAELIATQASARNPLAMILAQATAPRRLRPILSATPTVPAADRHFATTAPWVHERLTRPDLADPFWARMQHADALERATCPVLVLAGWQDIFLAQSVEQYTRLAERGVDVALTVGAWAHADITFGAQRVMAPESLAWLDTHLAHARPGARATPVHVEVTGTDAWVRLPAWPPASDARTLHLAPGGRLTAHAPGSGVAGASFTYDPADPTPTVGGNLLGDGGYADDSALAARADVLAYDGDRLPADLTVMGVPSVRLVHASDLPDADLFVRVSEVDGAGRSRNVSEGYVRVGARDGAGSATVDLELLPVAHTFRAGHRVRLLVAGGSFPQFSRNPGTGENPLTAARLARNRHTVVHADGGSALTLPVTAAA
ncbi:CocE/NonD family hydrolase [Tsukamurella soli]|uniref:CocE/NonD family hydrolase n=1 Tax=Tsukamurella soli TaxID=644556 RepID=A0ABP8JDZ2_9ACTN